MIADIKFACSHCGQHMLVAATAAGVAAECPGCGQTVTVPEARSREAEGGSAATDDERLLERLAADATLARAESKSFHSERLALKSELAQHRQRLAGVEAQWAASEEALAEAQQTAWRVAAERDSARADLEIVQQRAAATETQLLAKEADLGEMRTRLLAAENAKATAEAEATALQDESALLRRDLDDANTRLAHLSETEVRLAQAGREVAEVTARLAASEKRGKSAATRGRKLDKQLATLHRDLSETATGRELTELRAALAKATEERDRLTIEVRHLAEELQRADVERVSWRATLASTHQQLEAAERRAEATSDERLQQDNEALRGIIARQNGELAHRQIETLQLKRARFILRSAYVLVALGLAALVVAAVSLAPRFGF